MKKLNLALSIVAGLLGGALSHYIWTQPVHAQSALLAPKEVRSQSFVLVDAQGNVQGTFSVDERDDVPSIRLVDGQGHEIWRVGGNPMQLLAASPRSH